MAVAFRMFVNCTALFLQGKNTIVKLEFVTEN